MDQFHYRDSIPHRPRTSGVSGGAFVPTPAQQQLAAAYAVLWLRPGAPAPVVKAAYRALAQQHHPDHGGDPQTMLRLNAAYATINSHWQRVL
jgi:DnaJ-class molecular chaperone